MVVQEFISDDELSGEGEDEDESPEYYQGQSDQQLEEDPYA